MKKIVIIMLLFFAISSQANTIKSIEQQNVKQQLELLQNEKPENPTTIRCTTRSETFQKSDGNGGFYLYVETYTICNIIY